MEFMNAALDEARAALLAGEVPVGAVVVRDGKIVGRGRNRREGLRDATAHAEIGAIRDACRNLGDWRLSGCTLYVTLEPCAMCAGAIAQARLDAVIFGAADADFGCCGSRLNLPRDPRAGGRTRVAGGYMRAVCAKLLTDYFGARRAQKKDAGGEPDDRGL